MSYEPPVPPPTGGNDPYSVGGSGTNPYSQPSGDSGQMPPPPAAPQFPGQAPQYPGQAPQYPGEGAQYPGQAGMYGGQGYGGVFPQEHPSATTILVLGILGLLLCGPLGIAAWVMGNNATKEMEASGVEYSNAGTIKAGKILGIIATVFMGLGVLVFVFMAATGGLLAFSAGNF